MVPILTIPDTPTPPASNARLLYDQHRLEETVAFCQKELTLVEKSIPAKSTKRAGQENPSSPLYQFYALTALLVDALAQLGRWKAAREVLGRYRMHFNRDPWGYAVGAEVTGLDPDVQDRDAVMQAVEMLRAEAHRLEGKAAMKMKGR